MMKVMIEIVLGVFGVCILGMAAGAMLAVADSVRSEPEKDVPKETLSACLFCRYEKNCLDSVQAHEFTDECFEPENGLI